MGFETILNLGEVIVLISGFPNQSEFVRSPARGAKHRFECGCAPRTGLQYFLGPDAGIVPPEPPDPAPQDRHSKVIIARANCPWLGPEAFSVDQKAISVKWLCQARNLGRVFPEPAERCSRSV
jgi:hypothetical protein